jgi:hypothetical protein
MTRQALRLEESKTGTSSLDNEELCDCAVLVIVDAEQCFSGRSARYRHRWQSRHFGRDELLRRPDVAHVTVPNDIAYGKAMTYLTLRVATLLAGLDPPANAVIESVALDGFAAQLPLDLLTNADPAKAVAWLAIEPDESHWPMLPGKAESPGAVLYRLDASVGGEDPQRAMAVPAEEALEPIVGAPFVTT